jgi:predicted enzyme related to lactoylglutathione lyase
VFTVDHVQTAYEALSHAGLSFERKPHQVTDSAWAANFRDPDRHILSLFGPA